MKEYAFALFLFCEILKKFTFETKTARIDISSTLTTEEQIRVVDEPVAVSIL